MPVVVEDVLELESVDDEPSVTIDDTQSEATFTTSNRQESTYTRDDQSDISHSIKSKHDNFKTQGSEPVRARIANYTAKGALSVNGTRVILHLYEK